MAPQVEIASSSPFGCVLRDHNRHEPCGRENNARAAAAFQKNLKELVRDHLHTCISVSSDSAHDENTGDGENNSKCDSPTHGNITEKGSRSNNSGHDSLHMSTKHARNLDQWAARQAQEIVSTIESKNEEAGLSNSASRTSPTHKGSPGSITSTESGNLGASSLVQIWEARLSRRRSLKLRRSSSMNNNNQNSVPCTSRTSSVSSCNETAFEELRRDSCIPEHAFEELPRDSCTPEHAFEEALGGSCTPEHAFEEPLRGSCTHEHAFEEPLRDSCTREHAFEELSRESCIAEHETIEDSSVDLDLQTRSEPSIPRSISSDGERERVRIADIIRKLTSDPNDSEQPGNSVYDGLCRHRRQGSGSQQAEQKPLPQVLNIPKIRGRQAFNDLLSQMEQERKTEMDLLAVRQAVSKFNHRGRIQSMLRLRFLLRGTAIQDQQRPQSSRSTASSTDTNRSQGSTIMHLRERFNAGVEQATTITATGEVANHRSTAHTVNNSINTSNSSSASNQQTDHTSLQQSRIAELQSRIPVKNSVPQTSKRHEDLHAESIARADITNIQTPYEHQEDVRAKSIVSTDVANAPSPCELQEYVQEENIASTDVANIPSDVIPSPNPCELHEYVQAESIGSTDVANIPSPRELHEYIQAENIASTEVPWQGTNLEVDIYHPQGTSEATPSWNDWDGNEMEDGVDDDQYYEGINYDWFSEIARPRSYWEDQRQARYLEKLNTSSDDDELKKLLQRRTVSNFLDSDMRVKIDQLLICRSQREVDQHEELGGCSQEQMGQLMLSYFQRHLHPESNEEKQQVANDGGESREEVEEGQESQQEMGSPGSHQYLEASNDFYQSSPTMHTPQSVRSWNYKHNHEIPDHSENTPTIPPCPPMPSQDTRRDRRRLSPPRSLSSFEMELVCDLKGHMEQLQQEMLELRRSIMTCMEMQVTMQQCIKQEIHQGHVGGKRLLDTSTNQRSCCICYEKQVDSFLYRCGHMCTCLSCAHELQRSSGLCPVCQAPIMDVVKAQSAG